MTKYKSRVIKVKQNFQFFLLFSDLSIQLKIIYCSDGNEKRNESPCIWFIDILLS